MGMKQAANGPFYPNKGGTVKLCLLLYDYFFKTLKVRK